MDTYYFSLNCIKKVMVATVVLTLTACAGNKSGPVPDGYYRVQQGDTLYRIAKRYGQNVGTVASWNNLTNSSRIEVGQVLRVRRNVSSSLGNGVSTGSSNVSSARVVPPINRLTMQWPLDNAREHIIQQYNGVGNKGIDIAGVRGQPVKAAASGKVLYVGENIRGYGKLVLISHNTSMLTAYGNNDSILVQQDQTVSAGQTIATMGVGDDGRDKLHFEVRLNGKAADPMLYLPN